MKARKFRIRSASCKGNVTLQENAFVVDSKKASVRLEFDGLADSETYFSIEGLSFQDSSAKNSLFSEGSTGVKLKIKSSSGVAKSLDYRTEEFARNNNRHEFAVNFGYSKGWCAYVDGRETELQSMRSLRKVKKEEYVC